MLVADMHTTAPHTTTALAEADREMVVCNSCRYCEGLCAVFPAMEMRRVFLDSDLNYLANLCHSCGACYSDCQFAPPHEFAINVPRTLAQVRADSYQHYAWPGALAPLFKRNGLVISLLAALSVAAFLIGFVAYNDPAAIWQARSGAGSFYRLMPHNAMAGLFGAVFLFAVIAIYVSARRFWRDIAGSDQPGGFGAAWQAARDAARLRYLDGGRGGCINDDEEPTDRRKHYHHATFYGFLLCFASTSVATLYHYLLGREAPYAWYDLPVVLGTIGGIGLVVGPIGLLIAKRQRLAVLVDETRTGMDVAFIVMLLLSGVTGLALLVLRTTSLMGVLLAVHLGVIFALFLTLPYGKFVHGIYRYLALMQYARESRRHGL